MKNLYWNIIRSIFGNVSGMLLYTKTDEGISPDMQYKMGKNIIGVMALDLGVEFSKIAEQLNTIILKYFDKESIVF